MTQHSTRATSTLPGNFLQGRLLKRSWPVQLALVAALLLAVSLLFHAGSPVHAADNDVIGVTVTSANPGQLAISWDAPSRAPDDYRVTWKKSSGKWPSYKNDNTVDGNAFPTGTSHTATGLEEGTEYSVRVRARYFDNNDNLTENGPWSDPPAELTVSAQPPPKKGEGGSNQGRSTSPPAKPTGLLAAAMHNSVSLFWDNPNDDTITGYQILRGPDAANLAVLTNDTGSSSASYTDDTVTAETTYIYAVMARNANGLSPQSDPFRVRTPTAPEDDEPLQTAQQTSEIVNLLSNTGETATTTYQSVGTSDNILVAYRFTTGEHPGYYRVEDITLDVHDLDAGARLFVDIYTSFENRVANTANPSGSQYGLQSPSNLGTGLQTFSYNPLVDVILKPDTNYWVVISSLDTKRVRLKQNPASTAHSDTGSADDFEFHGRSFKSDTQTTWTTSVDSGWSLDPPASMTETALLVTNRVHRDRYRGWSR